MVLQNLIMKKLWLFGDSYAVQWNNKNLIHWATILTEKLNCRSIEIRAHNGAPNEWIYCQYLDHKDQISTEDYVVFVSTQMHRRWFFPDDIGSSNFNVTNLTVNNISVEQKKALEYYMMYLNNDTMAGLFFDSICNALHYTSLKNNINLLIVPGFEEKGFPISGRYRVNGSLFDVCMNEIKGKNLNSWHDYIAKKHQGIDPRCGHISTENHYILSEKIYNTFMNNDLLDLNSGFKEEFL